MKATINIQTKPTPDLWVPGQVAVVVPANALRDESNNPILDENGNWILTE